MPTENGCRTGIRFLGITAMKSSRTISIFIASAVIVIAGAVFVVTAFNIYPLDDSSIEVATSTPVITQPAAKPARLEIPAIEVEAEVVEVGVTADGSIATPKKTGDAGWAKYGVR